MLGADMSPKFFLCTFQAFRSSLLCPKIVSPTTNSQCLHTLHRFVRVHVSLYRHYQKIWVLQMPHIWQHIQQRRPTSTPTPSQGIPPAPPIMLPPPPPLRCGWWGCLRGFFNPLVHLWCGGGFWVFNPPSPPLGVVWCGVVWCVVVWWWVVGCGFQV